MGIPRYFGQVVRGLSTASGVGPVVLEGSAEIAPAVSGASHLCIDFNGMIYPALRRVEAAADGEGHPPREEIFAEVWRDLEALHRRIPAPHVFVAHDGVCPYAKVVQQRKRRLLRHLDPVDPPRPGSFDTAHVSPGTDFTADLVRFMHRRCAERGWRYSGADEPGEGEHKIFRWLSHQRWLDPASVSSVAVHGLDADILVLSMLWTLGGGDGTPTFVMRDDGDDSDDDRNQTCVDVLALRRAIHARAADLVDGEVGDEEIVVREYAFLMSTCGNDFLPRVPGMEVSPGTCDALLRTIAPADAPRAIGPDDRVDDGALLDIIDRLAEGEDGRVLSANERYLRGPGKELPVSPLAYRIRDARRGWRAEYHAWMCGASDPGTVAATACDFVRGMKFVWAYYTGNGEGLDWRWHYPWPHAPSFRDIANALASTTDATDATNPGPARPPITADEQLLAIIPAASAETVVPGRLRERYRAIEHYHPRSCRVCTWGVRRFHEVLPVLPVLPAPAEVSSR